MNVSANVRLALAIGVLWFVWGATPLGMRFAVATIPPFLMAAGRFGLSGLILCIIAIARGSRWPSAHDVRSSAIGAALLLVGGNGCMLWAIQFLPTGLTSVIVCLAPVWVVLIEYLVMRHLPSRLALWGIALGLIGMLVLLQPGSVGHIPLLPAFVALLSSVLWAAGSVQQRHAHIAQPGFAIGLQQVFGAVLFVAEGGFFGEFGRFDAHAVSGTSLIALILLSFGGGLLAYTAFIYVMRTASSALATTYAYVNPIVAVVLGALVFHERVTSLELLAGGIVVLGVALMVLPANAFRSRGKRATHQTGSA
jgi:drug/metabolite transporter (DMT)-like permease